MKHPYGYSPPSSLAELLERYEEGHRYFPEADLSGASMQSITLQDANFIGANLEGANLDYSELQGLNLKSANLRDARLLKVNLSEANLQSTDLRGARLWGANLDGVDAAHVNLEGAELLSCSLMGTDLDDGNLRGVGLESAILVDSFLRRTQLCGARFQQTILARTDLSDATGLDQVIHRGPSSLDDDTIRRSRRLPASFLRGVGLPEEVIEEYRSILEDSKGLPSCFISYSTADEEFSERLYSDLQAHGVRCWYAPHDLQIGATTRVALDKAIQATEKVILILSTNSVRSSWVAKEVETTLELETQRKETLLFPVRIDNTIMEESTGWGADLRRSRNIGDFTRWKEPGHYKELFQRILTDLKGEAGASTG